MTNTNNNVVNLATYKKAKIFVKDLEQVEMILKLTYGQLKKYRKYLPVQSVNNSIESSLLLIGTYLPKYRAYIGKKEK